MNIKKYNIFRAILVFLRIFDDLFIYSHLYINIIF
jgi:hypothetical protein